MRALHEPDDFRGMEAGPLFLTCRGTPLRTNAVRTIFPDLSHKAGVDNVHSHRLRHTFATWAIELHARPRSTLGGPTTSRMAPNL